MKKKKRDDYSNLIVAVVMISIVAGIFYLEVNGEKLTSVSSKVVSEVDNQQDTRLRLDARDDLFSEEFVSNELLIKVKKGVKLKEKPDDTGVASLDSLYKKYKVKKVNKIAKEGKNSRKDADIFRWYKVTLDKERKIVKSNRIAARNNVDEIDLMMVASEFKKDVNIEDVEFNYIVEISRRKIIGDGGEGDTITRVPNDPYYHSKGSWGQSYDDLYGLKKIDVSKAWGIATGSANMVIADVDTGVDRNHPDIAENMWVNSNEIPDNGVDDDNNGYVDDYYGWDFVNNDNDPMDDNGHGTHTAGTIAAVGNNGIGVVGVVWQAKIMALKFLDSSGFGTIGDGAEALVYAADNGAKISSNSWGAYGLYTVTEDAVKYEYERGMVIVAAAGNNNFDLETFSPASSDYVIAVGAFDYNDKRAWFSNWGEKLDVVAPGVGILSLSAEFGNICAVILGDYCVLSGTSMATPHVAGLAALILSRRPELNNKEVQSFIEASADDLLTPGFDIDSGYGRVNASNALLNVGGDLNKPDLVIKDIQFEKEIVASGAPFSVTVQLENLGRADANNFVIAIFDRAGGTNIGELRVSSLPARSSMILQQLVALDKGAGSYNLYFVVDPQNNVAEIFESNNIRYSYPVEIAYSRFPVNSIPNASLGYYWDYQSIYADKIVWVNYPDYNIYLYDVSTKQKRQLTNTPAFESFKAAPQIYGNYIVWEDWRNVIESYNDIYLYDLATNQERRITDAPSYQKYPHIYGNYVVWLDQRSGEKYYGWSRQDIYLYDLATNQERQIYTDNNLLNTFLMVSGNHIVWNSFMAIPELPGYGNRYINEYNLGTGQQRQFTSNPEGKDLGGIYEDKVIMMDLYLDEVYLYDLATNQERQITNDIYHQLGPDIYDNYIVYLEEKARDTELYLYDLTTNQQTRVTYNYHKAESIPRIWGDIITWLDNVDYSSIHYTTTTPDAFPVAPIEFVASSGTANWLSINLYWADNTESDIMEYNLYRSQTAGGPYNLLTSSIVSSYTDITVNQGVRYYYRVTAVDKENGESRYSYEGSAVPGISSGGGTGGPHKK